MENSTLYNSKRDYSTLMASNNITLVVTIQGIVSGVP